MSCSTLRRRTTTLYSTFQLESSVSVVPLGRGKVEEEGLKEKWVMEPRTTAFPFEIKSEP